MLVAVRETDEDQLGPLKLSVLGRFCKVKGEQWASENLQPGTTVNTDGLDRSYGVEAAGYEHKPRVTGGGKSAWETPDLT